MVGLGFENHVSAGNAGGDTWEHLGLACSDGICLMMISFMWLQVKASHFDGLITTILGYILLAGALIVCHVSFICMKLLYVYEITYSMSHISSYLLWLCVTV